MCWWFLVVWQNNNPFNCFILHLISIWNLNYDLKYHPYRGCSVWADAAEWGKGDGRYSCLDSVCWPTVSDLSVHAPSETIAFLVIVDLSIYYSRHNVQQEHNSTMYMCFGAGVGWAEAERAGKLWKRGEDAGEKENNQPFARCRQQPAEASGRRAEGQIIKAGIVLRFSTNLWVSCSRLWWSLVPNGW